VSQRRSGRDELIVKGETLLPILKNQPHPPQGSIIGLQPAALNQRRSMVSPRRFGRAR
jgi:hypothetical protein